MSDVFLGYYKQDQDAARSVARAIERSGLSVFHEVQTAPPASWQDEAREQIESAGCIVVLWSKASAQSQWVEREIRLAVRAWSRDRLVLARLDDAEWPVGLRDLPSTALKSERDTAVLVGHARAIVAGSSPPGAGSQTPSRTSSAIVRAIKTSHMVALMCSRNAFGSDHVIREIYVAGDYKKPFLLFQLDLSDLPDEILYFVSGFPRVPVDSIEPGQVRSEVTRLMAS